MTATPHQLDVGYATVEKMANSAGYGFMFSMAPKDGVMQAIRAVYAAMLAAAPADTSEPVAKQHADG